MIDRELRFTCQPNCSVCCQVEGEVYLSKQDLLKAAAFLNLAPETFEQQYCIRTRSQLRFRKPPDRQCHFHRDNCCSIHPAKPTQCRAFPFWPELLESESAWAEAAQYCPGMNQGELVNIAEAQGAAAEMKTAYPAMYQPLSKRQTSAPPTSAA